jgi:hypothetical protein
MRARRALLVTALTLVASGAGAGAAWANTTNGLTGACNMTNANAAYGMFTVAGNHANPNGFDIGMIKAIVNSNHGTFPDNCGGPAQPPPRP